MSDAEADAAAGRSRQFGPARPRHPDRPTVWAVLLASVAVAIAFPALEAVGWLLSPPKRTFLMAGSWLEAVPMVAAGLLVAVWIFTFWSLIGSFLNVVVHRLPLGQSVVHGGSRCPRCSSPIRWHDNLPVIGWLNLDGHCRSCGLPIAARYPIVESICAGLATAVYFRELLSGGANLPGRPPDFVHGGTLQLFPSPGLELVGLYLYHCGLLCVLLAWALITWDGRRVPGRSVATMLAVAAVLPLLFPLLHPLDLHGMELAPAADGGITMGIRLVQGLGVSLAGGVAGLLGGAALERLLRHLLCGDAAGRAGQPLRRPAALGIGLALVGVVLGWQGMLGTLIILLCICLAQIFAWSALGRWPVVSAELLLVPATFLELCFWRQLGEGLPPWWPATATPICLALPVAMVLAVAAALVAITPASGHQSRIKQDDAPEATTHEESATPTTGQPCNADS